MAKEFKVKHGLDANNKNISNINLLKGQGKTLTVPQIKDAYALVGSLGSAVGLESLKDNIALNAFRIATNGARTDFHLINQVVDEYIDESFIDTVASINEEHDNTNKLYKPTLDSAVKLLINSDGQDGSQMFDDESPSGHVITSNNGARKFAPKFGEGCLSLNGLNALSVEKSGDFNFGTSAFTVEFWIRKRDTSFAHLMGSIKDGSPFTGWYFYFDHPTQLLRFYSQDNTAFVSGTTNMIVDTWHHIAVSSNGSTIKLFFDGNQIASTSAFAVDATINDLFIGNARQNGSYTNACYDEVRISNVARYTTDFALQEDEFIDDANTLLLLHFNEEIEHDSSDSNHNVIFRGDTGIKNNDKKFGNSSLKLNGSTQYLSVPDSNDWDIFANNTDSYTVDLWIKHDNNTNRWGYLEQGSNSNNRWGLWYIADSGDPRGFVFFVTSGGSSLINIETNYKLTDTNWHHVALVINGNGSNKTVGVYVDGIQRGYATASTNADFTGALNIGRSQFDGDLFNGFIDECHITKTNIFSASPNVGLTNTITVPTSAHSVTGNTKFLMHFEYPNDFEDEAGDRLVTAVNGATLSTIEKKFGTGALKFDGSNDYLTIPDSTDWDILGSTIEDWTVDLWVKHNSLSGTQSYIYHATDVNNWWGLRHSNTTGLTFLAYSGGVQAFAVIQGTDTMSTATWYHVALVKKGIDYGIYLDGVQVAYFTYSSTLNYSGTLRIGANEVLSNLFNGYMDEIRIQKSNAFSANPKPMPYAYFKLNDDLATTNVIDIAKGNNGVASTNTNNLSVTGQVNDGFDFQGLYRVDISTLGANIKNDTKGSIALWFKGTVDNDGLFAFGASLADSHFLMRIVSGRISAIMQYNTSIDTLHNIGNTSVNDGNWHHLVITQDGSGIKFYVDGVLDTFFSTSGNQTTWLFNANQGGQIDRFYFGGTNSLGTGNSFINGSEDDLRYYSGVALTLAQVQEIYNSGSGTEVYYDTLTAPTGEHTSDANTKLLLHANSGEAEDFLDSGNTVHTITPNGGVGVTGVNGTGYGTFDGTNDYLLVDSNSEAFRMSTSDFTYEFWMRPLVLTQNRVIMSSYQNDNRYFGIYFFDDGNLYFDFTDVTTGQTAGCSIAVSHFTVGKWHHVAWVRNGASWIVFVDGVSKTLVSNVAPGTKDFLNNSSNFYIASGAAGFLALPTPDMDEYSGDLDEIRISKGIARYTSNFTPSLSNFTSDAYTSLLIHFDGDFIDYSDSGHTVTANNSAKITSPLIDGGHIKFDETTSDYIEIPDSDDWNFGTGDFTIDTLINFSTVTNSCFASHVTDANNMWYFLYFNNQLMFEVFTAGSPIISVIKSWTPTASNWYHIAVVRNGNNFKLFVDGTQLGTDVVDADSIPNYTSSLRIGTLENFAGYEFNGFMDEMRISKGIARWTSNFTPSNIEHTIDSFTKLLIHADSATIDSSSRNHIVTNQKNSFNYVKKYNEALALNGTSQYLSLPDDSDWDLFANTTSTYTFDLWVRHNSLGTVQGYFFQNDGTLAWESFLNGSGYPLFNIADGVGSNSVTSNKSISDNRWHHVCFVKVGGSPNYTLGIYIDGIQTAYLNINRVVSVPAVLWIGRTFSTIGLNGYIDEARISSGNIFSANPVVGLTDIITTPSMPSAIASDMELVSETFEALSEPTEARFITMIENVDTILENTDLKAYVSKDDGVTYAELTLVDEGTNEDNRRILSADVDLTQTGLGSGTDLRYKIETLNNKSCKIHASSLSWN